METQKSMDSMFLCFKQREKQIIPPKTSTVYSFDMAHFETKQLPQY